MLRLTHLTGFNVPRKLRLRSADFEGTAAYMSRGADLTGIADGKQGLISFWFRIDGGDSNTFTIMQSFGAVFRVSRAALGTFQVEANSAVPALILDISTVAAYTSSATWKHFLSSWDLNTAGARHIYVSDVSDLAVSAFTNATIDYAHATPNWSIGASLTPGNFYNGCLADFFFHTSYLDLSVTANRRKFISDKGRPIDLGPTGALPLGVQPLVYQSVRPGDPVTAFATNRGTGGNFAISGSLMFGSTSPSD
jgi:hypothetical protein